MNKYDALDLAFDVVNKTIQPKQLLSADREYLCKQLEPIVEAYNILKREESWLHNKKKKPTTKLFRIVRGWIK